MDIKYPYKFIWIQCDSPSKETVLSVLPATQYRKRVSYTENNMCAHSSDHQRSPSQTNSKMAILPKTVLTI